MRHCMEMLKEFWARGNFVCVGLDVDTEKMPAICRRGADVYSTIIGFNAGIVNATKHIASAYKPNWAFYLEYGVDGYTALYETIRQIHATAPQIPVILDAKVADIGKTNFRYVKGLFDYFGADAITVHPYLGGIATSPFLDQKEKGIIVLCKTSNEGADEFQDLRTIDPNNFSDPVSEHFITLYQRVAHNVAQYWNTNENCALVVGATYPKEMRKVREMAPEIPLLIPGVGAQGGDLEKSVRYGMNSARTGMIINSSSGIIFASNGTDYDEAAGRAAEALHNDITKIRKELLNGSLP